MTSAPKAEPCTLCGEPAAEVCDQGACRACHKSLTFEDCVSGEYVRGLQRRYGIEVEVGPRRGRTVTDDDLEPKLRELASALGPQSTLADLYSLMREASRLGAEHERDLICDFLLDGEQRGVVLLGLITGIGVAKHRRQKGRP